MDCPYTLLKKAAVANIFLIFASTSVWAQADKANYNLFNPTPKEQMRELSTDRPDKTESAYTVDAGHFQIETDIINFSRFKDSTGGVDTKAESMAVMTSNLKAGLTNSMDVQVVISPFQSTKTQVTATPDDKHEGFGDTVLRVKYNLFGNDGGDVAMALMPFIKFPTNSDDLGNDKVEGGLILPVSFSLPQDWGMGVMFQVNRMKNELDDHFHTEVISSITMGHDICGDLGGYFEFFNASSTETGAAWSATADFGLTYGLTPHLQLDGGLNLGLTDDDDDINPFLGISARF